MVGHVGEDHTVLEHREHGVHPGLAQSVVPPVEVEGGGDACEVDQQEPSLVVERFSIHGGARTHTVEPGQKRVSQHRGKGISKTVSLN